MSEPLEEKQLDELAAPCWSHDHPSFDHVSFARSVLHAALTQPAPQGVAEVMRLVVAHTNTVFFEGTEGDGDEKIVRASSRIVEQAITALVQERDAAQALAERLKLEAQIHAQEARTANATIAEIYQCVSGATGEPGNWHGAEPVRKMVQERDEWRQKYELVRDTDLVAQVGLGQEREITALEARVAELEGDAARLDWLEAQINEHGAIHLHDGNNAYGLGLGLRPGSAVRTLRAAIDASKGAKP